MSKSSDANLTYHQHDVHGNRSLDSAGASAGEGGERGAEAYGAVEDMTDAMMEALRARGGLLPAVGEVDSSFARRGSAARGEPRREGGGGQRGGGVQNNTSGRGVDAKIWEQVSSQMEERHGMGVQGGGEDGEGGVEDVDAKGVEEMRQMLLARGGLMSDEAAAKNREREKKRDERFNQKHR